MTTLDDAQTIRALKEELELRNSIILKYRNSTQGILDRISNYEKGIDEHNHQAPKDMQWGKSKLVLEIKKEIDALYLRVRLKIDHHKERKVKEGQTKL